MDDVKYIDIKEFRKLGYLQEVNRLFFHPLGLALAIVIDDTNDSETLGGILDYRDDAEGMFFGKGMIKKKKIKHVEEVKQSKINTRIAAELKYDGIKIDDDGVQVI